MAFSQDNLGKPATER